VGAVGVLRSLFWSQLNRSFDGENNWITNRGLHRQALAFPYLFTLAEMLCMSKPSGSYRLKLDRMSLSARLITPGGVQMTALVTCLDQAQQCDLSGSRSHELVLFACSFAEEYYSC
jgi:hypothetical protein